MQAHLLLLTSVVGGAALVVAGTFCLACGLYCAAEWLEDHVKTSFKIIQRYTLFCVVVQLLWLASDRSAVIPNLVGLASHLVSWGLLRKHPNHHMDQLLTILAAVLLICHQMSWLLWWNGTLTGQHQDLSFAQVASLLAAIVWPVPAMLLLSSAGSETLPVSVGPSAAPGRLSQATSLPLPQSPRSFGAQPPGGILSMRRGSQTGGTAAANGGSGSFGGGVAGAAAAAVPVVGDVGFHSRPHKSLVVQGFDSLKQLAHKHQLLPVTDADAEAPPGLMSKVMKD